MADRRRVAEPASCFPCISAQDRSEFGAALYVYGLRFQRVMNVVAFPARLLVVDLHVERQRKPAVRKERLKMSRQRLEDVLAGSFSGGEVAAFAKSQQHVEKSVICPAVGNGIVLASDGAITDAAEREDAAFHRGPAHDLDDFGHVDAPVEIGRIFYREMRHGDHSRSATEPQPPRFAKVPTLTWRRAG